MIVGYARVSSEDQDLSIQLETLKAAGCEKIFGEKVSGTALDGRQGLSEALRFVREGDTLIVTRIDRLARSVRDFSEIVHGLKAKGVDFRCTEQPIDTRGPTGNLLMNILAAVAEFETQLRRERQAEGIAKAKAEGRYAGRPASIDREEIARLLAEGKSAIKIARELKCKRNSVYRIRDELKASAAQDN